MLHGMVHPSSVPAVPFRNWLRCNIVVSALEARPGRRAHGNGRRRHKLETQAHVPLFEVAALAATVALHRKPRLNGLSAHLLSILKPVPAIAHRVLGAAGQLLGDE
jgi:hypothetical protein